MARKPLKGNSDGKGRPSGNAQKARGSARGVSAIKPAKASGRAAPGKMSAAAKKPGGITGEEPIKGRPSGKIKASSRKNAAPTGAKKKPKKKTLTAAAGKTGGPARQPDVKKAEAKRTGRAVKRGEPPKTPARPEREIFPVLPKEYGENDLLLMVVDPNVLYAAWEIKTDALPKEPAEIAMRVSDVRGGGIKGNTVFEIKIDRRVGSGFFEIRTPGRDVIAEIGFFSARRPFRTIMRSGVVSFPPLLAPDALGIVRKLFGPGIPFGY